MQSIRQQDFVVLVITDQYMKSVACMYEVVQLMKDSTWREKTMFAVIHNTDVYTVEAKQKYVLYWENTYENVSNSKALPTEEIEKYYQIEKNIHKFLTVLSDTKNPSEDIAISEIVKRVEVGKYE